MVWNNGRVDKISLSGPDNDDWNDDTDDYGQDRWDKDYDKWRDGSGPHPDDKTPEIERVEKQRQDEEEWKNEFEKSGYNAGFGEDEDEKYLDDDD